MPRRLLALIPLSVVLACAVNPATGRREISLIGEGREIEMGRGADAEISASLGLVDDPELQAYVSGLGERLAATSERPTLPWSFKVVDDPTVNAFALPGGFIFVTRGILAHFESEAELVGVLGHEIGHVTARHSVSQMSRQQLQQIGLGVGMILSEDVRRFGDVLGAGLQLMNLRYSRGDETQADELGLRYMTRISYDAEQLVGVFQMLARVSGGAGGRIPEWQLTHPYPENREEHIRGLIAASGAESGTVARERYLEMLDGIVFGENPREGYFEGSRFFHPELAFQLAFPEGWTGVNQRSLVAAVAPGEDAVVMLQLVPDASDPLDALRDFLRQEGVSGGQIRNDDAEGVARSRATFGANVQDGSIRGEASFIGYGGRIYRLLGYAPSARWGAYSGVVGRTLSSFARVTDRAVLDVRPRRVDIVTLDEAASVSALAETWGGVASAAELALLNRRTVEETIPAGTRVKRIVR